MKKVVFCLSLLALVGGMTVVAAEVTETSDIEVIDTSVIEETTEEPKEDVAKMLEKAEIKHFIGGELTEVDVKSEEEKKQEEYDKELDKDLKAMKEGKGYAYKIPKKWKSEFKSYMRYTAVTSKSSPQYKLLNSEDASTDENGIRTYRGRYCIAMGSGFASKIGTKIDLVMANGKVLQCILGDQKSDRHTTKNNMVCMSNGSIAEFIVDYSVFLGKKDSSGTVNWIKGFDGKISKVIVYTGKNGEEDIEDSKDSKESKNDKKDKKSAKADEKKDTKKKDDKKTEVTIEVTEKVTEEVTTENITESITEESTETTP